MTRATAEQRELGRMLADEVRRRRLRATVEEPQPDAPEPEPNDTREDS